MPRLVDARRGRIERWDDAWSRRHRTGPSGVFGRYQEIVHHGVLLEEDGWVVPFIFVLDEERSGSRTREKTNKTSLKL